MVERIIPITDAIRRVQVKTYGNINLEGVESDSLLVIAKNSDAITIMQSEDVIYITAMDRCDLQVPASLEVSLEKILGSIHIKSLKSPIHCEKVLGNVMINGATNVGIEKIGGNCSIKDLSGQGVIEKVGGNFVAENFSHLVIEKIGGNCLLKNGQEKLEINKVGGQFSGEGLRGFVIIQKVGGNLICNNLTFGARLKVGGDAKLSLSGEPDITNLSVGGDVHLTLPTELTNVTFKLNHNGLASFHTAGINVSNNTHAFEQVLGNGDDLIEINAGGNITVTDEKWVPTEIDNSVKVDFSFSESNFSETIHDQVRRASELAATKISETQKRLDEFQSKVTRDIDRQEMIGFDPADAIQKPHHVDKAKHVSDEERLLILQMLQDKKITVDEAEQLFKSLEKNK